MAIQTATIVVRALRETNPPDELHTMRNIPEECCRPSKAGPVMSQPVFKWKVPERHVELLNFAGEVANVLQVEAYDLSEEGNMPIIKDCLGREGHQFIQTLTNAEKWACKSATYLFNGLKGKFRWQHNEMIFTVQYC